jgi:putative membrane protein
MLIFARFCIALLVLTHCGFFALETLFWDKAPEARESLGFYGEVQSDVARVLKNQGVSNAFLAAGLLWGLLGETRGKPEGRSVLMFFLACVAIAGLVGYLTVQPPTMIGSLGFLVGQTGLAVVGLCGFQLSGK